MFLMVDHQCQTEQQLLKRDHELSRNWLMIQVKLKNKGHFRDLKIIFNLLGLLNSVDRNSMVLPIRLALLKVVRLSAREAVKGPPILLSVVLFLVRREVSMVVSDIWLLRIQQF